MSKLYPLLTTMPDWIRNIIYIALSINAILLIAVIIKQTKKFENYFLTSLVISMILAMIIFSYSFWLVPQIHPYTVIKKDNHIILKSNSAFLESAKLSIEKELKNGYLVEYNSNYYKIKKSDITD